MGLTEFQLAQLESHPSKCIFWPTLSFNEEKVEKKNIQAGTATVPSSIQAYIVGSYFHQNMREGNILTTSVLLNYPKVCTLTKKITKSTFWVTKWSYLGSEAENKKNF